ncbi:hypothetical protein [Butyrivibrio sp. AE2032]|uniref:hypothetical protein n=1 Tax=Butyrivibrio sp. AE2032 TaxID=1458463 RepID=UPI000A435A50|nr:hypothetical protein [Butyrivibrio sp. AE2032]
MSDNKSDSMPVEGTQFYKQSSLREAFRIIVTTVIVFSLLSVFTLWAAIDIGARQAYKEARDIRKALKAVGTEYYGELTSIYDPNKSDGLADGAAKKVADISTRNGSVVLLEWDDISNGPVKFEYRKGLYRVVYTDTGKTTGLSTGVEGTFTIYYSLEVLNYDAQ